jgi:hypothetical protein
MANGYFIEKLFYDSTNEILLNGQDGEEVPGLGGVANVGNGSITLAKLADLAQDQVIGRISAGTGVPETFTVTSAARGLLNDATVGDMRTTLGFSANGASLVTAATYAAMRGLLDLEAGTDFNPYSTAVSQFAGLVDPNADRMVFWDDSAGSYAYLTPGTGLSITGTTINATAAGALDDLSDVAITAPATGHILRHDGTGFVNVLGTTIYQPLDADLTAIAALSSVADRVPYSTGAQAWALATLTPFARTLLDDADQATALATLGAAAALGTVTLSTGTIIVRATHGNRLLVCDTAATHTISDDAEGGWLSGDGVYGVNTSAGNVIFQGDASPAVTLTANAGQTLTVPAGASFVFSRTGAQAWRGGATDPDLITLAGLTPTAGNFVQSAGTVWSSRTPTQVNVDLSGSGLTAAAAGFRGLPVNSQSAAYTAVAADAGKLILHPSTDNNPRTFTIPSNTGQAYEIGAVLTWANMINTVTIAITTDTLILAGAGTTGSRTLAANGIASAVKVTTTSWLINGTGLT